MTRALPFVLLAAPFFLHAQESALQADFRHEGEDFRQNCAQFSIIGCGQLLATGHPLHIAVGSLAPKNGVGFGLAFVTHYTPNERWRLFFNADAVGTRNGSWRAGAYLSAVLVRPQVIKVVTGSGSPSKKPPSLTVREMPVFHAYAQSISLQTIPFYGLGPGANNQLSFFRETETIAGGDVIWPLFDPLRLSVTAEANGRFFSIGNAQGAPQPSYAQFGQGVLMKPVFASGYFQLNYRVGFQQWLASNSSSSFRRFRADLSHQFNIYRNSRLSPTRTFNGPDSCAQDANSLKCPSVSRNLEGSIELRFLYTTSATSSGNTIPFYLDPTIGGTDINGTALLASFPDYRFRGPDFMVFRAAFEHSLFKLPIGVKALIDEGKIGMRASDLSFDHLAHSYAAGFTLHAGGLPVVDLLFAWGGGQGSRTIATVSPSLLGGTARPPLE